MDTNSLIKSKVHEIVASLKRQGADKPNPEEAFSMLDHKGDMIYLIGQVQATDVNLDNAYRMNKVILSAMRKNLLSCVQEVTQEGLLEALLRVALPSGLGFDITTDSEIPEEEFLLENHGVAAVVTVSMDDDEDLVRFLFDNNITVMTLGHVTKGDIRIDDYSYGNIRDI
ncbi:MAG: AIR synthase-related protein [Bacteroidales bacterium]|jgi:phosphoribosylformylglycinamidine synthase